MPRPPVDPAAATPPGLSLFTRLVIEVDPVVSLGGPARHGERRFVTLRGGTAEGPGFEGTVLDGGVDWQVLRADGALDINAHYVLRSAGDGALVEVQSEGVRHGPPEVMAALARGEPVPAEAVYFRTAVRLTSGHPAWGHVNRMLFIATGQREAARVRLDVWRVG
jgi:hypothetical protein